MKLQKKHKKRLRQGANTKATFLYHISRQEVENGNVGRLVNDLRPHHDNLMTRAGPGCCMFYVEGYDDDSRELYEIPEFLAFVRKANESLPCWIYFSDPEWRWINLIAFCSIQNASVFRKLGESNYTFLFPGAGIADFLLPQIEDYNALCALAKVSDNVEDNHLAKILRSLGLKL